MAAIEPFMMIPERNITNFIFCKQAIKKNFYGYFYLKTAKIKKPSKPMQKVLTYLIV
jgi:hypothetical protein